MENKKQNRIEEVVGEALKNLNEIISTNRIIGSAIETKSGDEIFPVSKITFGVLSGGGEYGKTGIFSNGKNYPFSAGNGAIVSVTPCAFLIKGENGAYKFVSNENSLGFIVDKVVDFVENLKDKNK